MIRPICTLKDPVLRRKAKKIEKINRETQKLIDDMVETMRHANGVGLAAPQVGVSERLAIVEIPKDENDPTSGITHVLINPEISKPSPETDIKAEGCLSIPGWRGEVERPVRVTVRATDRSGTRIKFEANGYLARVIQHEVDHLDGVLYTDKLIAPDRVWRINENEDESDEDI